MKKLTEPALRASVERLLKQEIPDRQWARVRALGWVDTVLEGSEPVAWLVEEIRGFQRDFSSEPEPGAKQPSHSLRKANRARLLNERLTRQDALCVAVGGHAERDIEVVFFRHEVLQDQLLTYAGHATDATTDATTDSATDSATDLPREAVDAWRARRGESVDAWRARRGESVDAWLARQEEFERPRRAAEDVSAWPRLSCVRVFGAGEVSLPVEPGGVLDILREIAERVANRYQWTPAGAVGFVLADALPNVRTFAVTVRPNHDLPALSRVVIEVDPYRTPDEVAAMYQRARDGLLRSRPRTMSMKHLCLGAFAATRPPREPLAEQMAAWNATVPDLTWRYEMKHVANFARDRAKALKRLLRPEYQLPVQEETSSYDDFAFARDAVPHDPSDDDTINHDASDNDSDDA